jgi:hypothetical protein
LEKLFGKKFTVGLLRHSYISEGIDFTKSLPGELFDAAKHMRHSIAQQHLYRRKVESPPIPSVILSQETGGGGSTKKKKQPSSTFVPQGYIDVAF